jgi:hypothetical protein
VRSRSTRRLTGLIATAAAIAVVGATAAGAAPAKAPPGVTVYPDADIPGASGGVFRTCHLHPANGKQNIYATTTNDGWDMFVRLSPWRGFGHRYVVRYGDPRHDVVKISGEAGTFTTAYPPPPGFPVHPAGFVTFRPKGRLVSVNAVTFDGPYTSSVLVHGAMRCVAGG